MPDGARLYAFGPGPEGPSLRIVNPDNTFSKIAEPQTASVFEMLEEMFAEGSFLTRRRNTKSDLIVGSLYDSRVVLEESGYPSDDWVGGRDFMVYGGPPVAQTLPIGRNAAGARGVQVDL